MSSFDRFLAYSFGETIKKNLSEPVLKELEHSLFFSEGMSIKLSMEHYGKFHNKLRTILNSDSTRFEKQCLEKVCKIKESKEQVTMKILDPSLIQKILAHWGDEESRNIMSLIMTDEKTIPEILESYPIPKTSVYRKIENLIIDGMIIETKKVLSQSKKVSKHRCVFEKIDLKFSSKSIEIVGYLSIKEFRKSTIAKNLFN